jgi:hypothetical protein
MLAFASKKWVQEIHNGPLRNRVNARDYSYHCHGCNMLLSVSVWNVENIRLPGNMLEISIGNFGFQFGYRSLQIREPKNVETKLTKIGLVVFVIHFNNALRQATGNDFEAEHFSGNVKFIGANYAVVVSHSGILS